MHSFRINDSVFKSSTNDCKTDLVSSVTYDCTEAGIRVSDTGWSL